MEQFNVKDIRTALAKAMKDRIEAYATKLAALRKEEPAPEPVKVEIPSNGKCPLCNNADAPGSCSCLVKNDKGSWAREYSKSKSDVGEKSSSSSKSESDVSGETADAAGNKPVDNFKGPKLPKSKKVPAPGSGGEKVAKKSEKAPSLASLKKGMFATKPQTVLPPGTPITKLPPGPRVSQDPAPRVDRTPCASCNGRGAKLDSNGDPMVCVDCDGSTEQRYSGPPADEKPALKSEKPTDPKLKKSAVTVPTAKPPKVGSPTLTKVISRTNIVLPGAKKLAVNVRGSTPKPPPEIAPKAAKPATAPAPKT